MTGGRLYPALAGRGRHSHDAGRESTVPPRRAETDRSEVGADPRARPATRRVPHSHRDPVAPTVSRMPDVVVRLDRHDRLLVTNDGTGPFPGGAAGTFVVRLGRDAGPR